MDSAPRSTSSRRPTGGAPVLQCQDCRMPVLLASVERDGERRWVDCPYCERHDEWMVPVPR